MNAEIEKHIEQTSGLFSTSIMNFDFDECQKMVFFCVIIGISASEIPYFDDDIVNNWERLANIMSSNLNDDDRMKIKIFVEEKSPTIIADNDIDSEESFVSFLEKYLSEFGDNARENCLVYIYEYLMKDDTHLYKNIDNFDKFAKEEFLLKCIVASAGVSSDRVKGRIEEFFNLVKDHQALEAADEGVDRSEDGYYEDGDLILGVSEDEVKAARAILARGFESLQGMSDEEQAILTKVMLAFSRAGHLFGGPDDSDTD